MRNPYLTREARDREAERLAARYDAGATIRALAAETGRSYSCIHGLLAHAGVTFRPRGGPRKRTK